MLRTSIAPFRKAPIKIYLFWKYEVTRLTVRLLTVNVSNFCSNLYNKKKTFPKNTFLDIFCETSLSNSFKTLQMLFKMGLVKLATVEGDYSNFNFQIKSSKKGELSEKIIMRYILWNITIANFYNFCFQLFILIDIISYQTYHIKYQIRCLTNSANALIYLKISNFRIIDLVQHSH